MTILSKNVGGFSVDNASSLAEISSGGRIHLIGICGVAMAPLAVSLAQQGYRVSGSDREFYEPMSSVLRSSPITLLQGYSAEAISSDIDLVIVGNSARASNPEVEATARYGLRYSLFPKLLADTVIGHRHSCVVAGTHGKSTTTALLAKVLVQAGRDPSYFFGAQSFDTELNAHIGSGSVAAVEGDEYDSAFFAKYPKFHFYRPNTLLLTSLEFDHADIYPNLEAIVAEFRRLLESMPQDGLVVACVDYPAIVELVGAFRGCRVITYGASSESEVRVSANEAGDSQDVTLHWQNGEKKSFTTPLPGFYNALNSAAVFIAASSLSVEDSDIRDGLRSYRGLKRRQEIRYANSHRILVDDFAHHPTAVRATLAGLRRRYPDWRIRAVFEPRSNTSRRKVFEQDYIEAFDDADEILLSRVEARPGDESLELMDTKHIVEVLNSRGRKAAEFQSPDELFTALANGVHSTELVLLMSNGAFGGLPARLEEAFRQQA